MTYLSPLAYVLGIEGVALLRGIREGSADEEFVAARLAEIHWLLDHSALGHAGGVTAVPGAISSAEIYREWAPDYDAPGNGMIDVEQPIVRRILDGLPVGTALDAACGTGRHAAYLAELGHRVIGIDESPEMLERAAELPDSDFRQADLDRIPLADNAVLLSYLRPTLVRRPGPDGRPSVLSEYHRPLSEYLAEALPIGFQLRFCEEPSAPRRVPSHGSAPGPLPTEMSWASWTGAQRRRLLPMRACRRW